MTKECFAYFHVCVCVCVNQPCFPGAFPKHLQASGEEVCVPKSTKWKNENICLAVRVQRRRDQSYPQQPRRVVFHRWQRVFNSEHLSYIFYLFFVISFN